MNILFVIVLILLVVLGPQWWARYTFRRYAAQLDRIPGSGAELAQHLLGRFGVSDVRVEQTERGTDRYDPENRTVYLGPENFAGRSLSAVATAAHEVGHALQHHRGEPMLALRHRMVRVAQTAQQVGAGAMMLVPIAALVTRSPVSGLAMGAIGLASMASATLVHLVTLPVELDASFGKALPILKAGRYIEPSDEAAVKRILRAAALTYVAGSLASLLNLARWIALLRRA